MNNDKKKKNEKPIKGHARHTEQEPTDKSGKEDFSYPAGDDIYNRDRVEADIDPENTSELKVPSPKVNAKNEKDFEEDMTGGDLDVPGAELDDEQERNGSEDEENNYYSLGDNNTKI